MGGKWTFAAVSINGSFGSGIVSNTAFAAVVNCIGIGFRRDKHTHYQLSRTMALARQR